MQKAHWTLLFGLFRLHMNKQALCMQKSFRITLLHYGCYTNTASCAKQYFAALCNKTVTLRPLCYIGGCVGICIVAQAAAARNILPVFDMEV